MEMSLSDCKYSNSIFHSLMEAFHIAVLSFRHMHGLSVLCTKTKYSKTSINYSGA